MRGPAKGGHDLLVLSAMVSIQCDNDEPRREDRHELAATQCMLVLVVQSKVLVILWDP